MTRPEPARTRDRVRTTRVGRTIAADPTSTALLLAGPTAIDLWPGLRRTGERDGRVLVETAWTSVGALSAGQVRALPPRRTPTAYVTLFETTGPGIPPATGTLTLSYAPAAGDGLVNTRAVLELTVDGDELAASGVSDLRVRALSKGFLDNLAGAAEARNRAA